MAKKKPMKKSSKKPVKKAAKKAVKKPVKKAAKKAVKKPVKKAAKKKVVKKSPRCMATMKDPKTGRTRRCKNKVAGNSKYCASHKK